MYILKGVHPTYCDFCLSGNWSYVYSESYYFLNTVLEHITNYTVYKLSSLLSLTEIIGNTDVLHAQYAASVGTNVLQAHVAVNARVC